MISDDDCRALADIERHLQEDPDLRRVFGRRVFGRGVFGRRAFGRGAGAVPLIRRVWQALLVASLVLAVASALLHAGGAAFESAALAVAIGTGLRRTSRRAEFRAGHRSVRDQRA